MSIINELQNLYKNNYKDEICTGIQISTDDNFEWHVSIDLFDTPYEQGDFKTVYEKRSISDWFTCIKENQIFKGTGGIKNLEDILDVFHKWITLKEE